MARQVSLRNKEELELIRKSGQITAQALKKVIEKAQSGITLTELDQIAEEEIKRLRGYPAFKTVPDYLWATCLDVNDEVVHGIPRDIKLKNGDVLKIDLGTVYEGWYSDAAWTVIVGKESDPKTLQAKFRFLKTGEKALEEAIKQAKPGNRIGDISWAIQKNIEKAGFHVVKSLTGHGVGKSYHEEPEIPEYGKPGTGLKIEKGMVLAIEAIYTAGSGKVIEKEDGWTIASIDNSWGGLFENTVIIGEKDSEIVTDWRTL